MAYVFIPPAGGRTRPDRVSSAVDLLYESNMKLMKKRSEYDIISIDL
jgi:hypothetical protein